VSLSSKKRIHLLGIEFSPEERNIDSFEEEILPE